MGRLAVYGLGTKGVNVDKHPLAMEDNELREAQNFILEPLGVELGLTQRPGFAVVNAAPGSGAVLGGQSVAFPTLATGTRVLFFGRGRIA